MKATIDAAGRIVIPKEVRRKAGLHPGMTVEVRYDDGRISIEPEPLSFRLERRGHAQVLVPEGEVEPVPRAVFDELLQTIRNERGLSRS
jgi:AbrB family looped-hinge helix DNA binding protein